MTYLRVGSASLCVCARGTKREKKLYRGDISRPPRQNLPVMSLLTVCRMTHRVVTLRGVETNEEASASRHNPGL